jgi:hypothetical protein
MHRLPRLIVYSEFGRAIGTEPQAEALTCETLARLASRSIARDDAELVQRPVVGVVAHRRSRVGLLDDAAQIAMVLQSRIGDVKAPDLNAAGFRPLPTSSQICLG